MKVKSKRAYITKKYTFIDDNDKDVNVEFKYYAPSTKQAEAIQGAGDKINEVIKEIASENLIGDEPYKSTLIEYLYSEDNIYEEFGELQEELGKLKKKK
jgi:hypothetical protein